MSSHDRQHPPHCQTSPPATVTRLPSLDSLHYGGNNTKIGWILDRFYRRITAIKTNFSEIGVSIISQRLARSLAKPGPRQSWGVWRGLWRVWYLARTDSPGFLSYWNSGWEKPDRSLLNCWHSVVAASQNNFGSWWADKLESHGEKIGIYNLVKGT